MPFLRVIALRARPGLHHLASSSFIFPLVSLHGLALPSLFGILQPLWPSYSYSNVPWPSATWPLKVLSPLPAMLFFPSPTSGVRILHLDPRTVSAHLLRWENLSNYTLTWRLSLFLALRITVCLMINICLCESLSLVNIYQHHNGKNYVPPFYFLLTNESSATRTQLVLNKYLLK